MIGYSLAHYRIDQELGRGGMGIVYKATDTKLGRTVAIKVLPPAALAQEGDRARFFREAQSAAALSHPNVCHVYGVDEAVPTQEGIDPQPGTDSRLFIAMEFIEGQTLQDYIRDSGPMKLTEAVSVASQVAEALKAAHAKDIVHRDIKSANVMITSDGVIKVLDFGLAKTNQSTQLTRMGSTLGTVAYMSPEQARGQEVDGRTDLYSLGTMMYEMIAGRLPFDGEYEQAVVYSILNENPEPLTAIRTGVPMQLEWIVNKLLSKDAEYRYQSAAGLLADLKSADLSGAGMSRRSMAAASGAGTGVPAASAGSDKSPGSVLSGQNGWIVLALAVVVSAVLGFFLRPVPEVQPEPVRKLSIQLDGLTRFGQMAGSPDGRYWAFSGQDTLGNVGVFLWDVEKDEINRVPDSRELQAPSFSPDGSWLALRRERLELYRVRVPDGSPLFVDSLGTYVWLDETTFLAGIRDQKQLFKVSSETGLRTPLEVTLPDSSTEFLTLSDAIPGTDWVLAEARKISPPSRDVLLINARTGAASVLVPNAFGVQALGDDTILYVRRQGESAVRLIAQRFDPTSGELTGVSVDTGTGVSRGHFYTLGGHDEYFEYAGNSVLAGSMKLSWLDPESGTLDDLDFPRGSYDRVSISPDASKLALQATNLEGDNDGSNIYIIDLETGTRSRLTYTVDLNREPTWSVDGKIYFTGGPPRTSDIYVKNADGSGEEILLIPKGSFPDVSRDGKWLAYMGRDRVTSFNGNIQAMNLETKEVVFVDSSDANLTDPEISPNGRYIVYSKSEMTTTNTVTQEQRIYVRSFPDPTRFYQQVVDGMGDDPHWSADGKTLYYRVGGSYRKIGVDTEGTFRVTSLPEEMVEVAAPTSRFEVAPSSGRLILVHRGRIGSNEARGAPELGVILSFSRYLDQLFGDEE